MPIGIVRGIVKDIGQFKLNHYEVKKKKTIRYCIIDTS